VVEPDTPVRMQAVKVARTARDVSVIAEGVKPGETVVVDGQFRLTPGARVMIKPPAGAAPVARAADAGGGGGGGAGGHTGSTRRAGKTR
jgi:multidrug efflux system membrane fusion protein